MNHLQVSPARRRGAFAAVATVVAVTAASLLSVGPVTAQALGQAVTLDPVAPEAWQPFTVQVDLTGCTPGQSVTFEVNHVFDDGSQVIIDVIELGSATVQVDAEGEIHTSIPIPVAYPGQWDVQSPPCDSVNLPMLWLHPFEIAAPSDFVLSVGGEARAGDIQLDLDGSGCPADQVSWSVRDDAAAFDEPDWLTGTAVPMEGAWSAHVILVADPALGGDAVPGAADAGSLRIDASCDFPNGVSVGYASVVMPLVPGDPPPSTTTTVDDGILSTPRYAG